MLDDTDAQKPTQAGTGSLKTAQQRRQMLPGALVMDSFPQAEAA